MTAESTGSNDWIEMKRTVLQELKITIENREDAAKTILSCVLIELEV